MTDIIKQEIDRTSVPGHSKNIAPGGLGMDNKQFAKQMIQFNKTAFDMSFNTLNMVYEQNHKMVESFLAKTPGMPEEGKKLIQDWMSAYRNGCNDFKKLVDDNYAKVAEYFDQ
ncbi:MAG: hypothetical protein ACWGOX_15205 [Desulforhopalus sp.]